MKPYFDLLRLWLREYFKHPVENIRQANPIVPGRLYRNFGNICKAVPYTNEQTALLEEEKRVKLKAASAKVVEDTSSGSPSGISPEGALEMIRTSGGNKKIAEELQMIFQQGNLEAKCAFCDFDKKGIPCPIHNKLPNGRCVCDTHRYVIIKPVKHVY